MCKTFQRIPDSGRVYASVYFAPRMFEFHTDKGRYFEMQRRTAAEYILPQVHAAVAKPRPWRVLEVGCAEAGVLKAFLDAGHTGVGIELETWRADLARDFLSAEIAEGRVDIRTDDIYEVDPSDFGPEGFDLIILKDVIEHIPAQERMLPRLREFLAPGGVMFFGFPPWYMPFGGHQQIARSKRVTRIPWLHLLPEALYSRYLRGAGEADFIVEELEGIRATQISIERFERLCVESGLRVRERTLWLFNPIYAMKFGLKARALPKPLAALPGIRNLYTTAAYYIVEAT